MPWAVECAGHGYATNPRGCAVRLAETDGLRGVALDQLKRSGRFFAHVFLRQTHRPWDDVAGLFGLVGDAQRWRRRVSPRCVRRRAALEQPDAFAAHRRGLAKADRAVQRIFDATRELPDVTYLVYSNHGEVFDHFRYHVPHPDPGDGMIVGTCTVPTRTRCSTGTCRCG